MPPAVEDEIVEEIRRHRRAHSESLECDLTRITEDLQRQERDCGAQVVQRAPRRPRRDVSSHE
jgi:hypothetical protein